MNPKANTEIAIASRSLIAREVAERPKLSDPAHGTQLLQPRRSRRVRCSAWLGGVVTSVSSKLLNDVALQAVREQREAGSKRKESEACDNRARRAAAGGRNVNEGSQRHP